MGTFSPPRSDLNAHERALRLSTSEVVQEMADVIGRKLTAYIGGVKDVRAIDQWIGGREMHSDTEQRLRFAFQIVDALHEHNSAKAVQAWLTGVNPELGDRVPLRLLRKNDINEAPAVLRAALAFLAGA